jgi:hypothetical protein
MSDNRHFDEYIKGQFSNYSPDVHPRIWKNIVAESSKKKPAGFWVSMLNNRNKLLLLGLVIALSSGGAWLYYNHDLLLTGSQQVSGTQQKNEGKNKSGATTTTPTQEISNIPVTSPGTNEPVIPGAANTVDATGKNNQQITAGNLKAAITPAEQGSADDSNEKPARRFDNKKYTGLGNVLINTTTGNMAEDEDAFAGQGTLLGRLTFNAEKYISKRTTGKDDVLNFKPIIISVPDCPGLEKDAAGNKRYLEFYAGPDYAIRSLQDTGNSAYLQQRKESTRFKSAFSAGVRYTKVFNNSMSVRAGINFSQINEKFKYSQGNIVQVTYIINSNGDTVGSYTTTGTRYKTTINRYRTIDIPLVAGYELGNGKLHANINAGAIINIYSWQKGDVMDRSGNPVSITTGKSSSQYQFRTNAGVGFIGAVSVYYKLNDRWRIMAEPYFRYNFTPMNKENITLKQRYQTAGLRLGLRFDLD